MCRYWSVVCVVLWNKFSVLYTWPGNHRPRFEWGCITAVTASREPRPEGRKLAKKGDYIGIAAITSAWQSGEKRRRKQLLFLRRTTLNPFLHSLRTFSPSRPSPSSFNNACGRCPVRRPTIQSFIHMSGGPPTFDLGQARGGAISQLSFVVNSSLRKGLYNIQPLNGFI